MKYEEKMVENQIKTGIRKKKEINEMTHNFVEHEVGAMIFEEKISLVHNLLKSLKLDFTLEYEDEEGEGYSIFILDPALRVVDV